MRNDYFKSHERCTACGESPDSATHWFLSNGHQYKPPLEAAERVLALMENEARERKLRDLMHAG